MQLDEFLHQGQADAAALVRSPLGVLDAVEALEQPRHFMGGNAGACIAHDEFGGAARLTQRDGDLAFEGELEGVGQQVEDDLFPHRAVHEHRLAQARAIDAQFQPGLLAGRAEVAGQIGGEFGKVDWLEGGADATGLDARELQQAVHQPLQAQAVAVHHLQLCPVGRRQLVGVGQGVFHRPQHQGQWGAEFMADVGEEGRLGAVEFGQCLGASSLVLIRAGVDDGGGHGGSQQVTEAAVGLVHR